MAIQKQQKGIEEEILPKVRKVATIVFGLCWIFGVALLSWRILPMVYGRGSVPLHYNIFVGIDAFGPWWMLFEIPVWSLVIAIGNGGIAATVFKKKSMLALALWIATMFVGILSLIALLRIVLINIAYG